MGVPPHIRDALEQARIAAEEKPRSPLIVPPRFPKAASTQQDAEDMRLAQERANVVDSRALKAATSTRRESSLVSRLAGKEKQVRDMRAYVHDALYLQNKQHAYLRATHLDPAIGLEIQLLASTRQVQHSQPLNSDIEEVKAALTASELARDELRRENFDLQTQLREAKEWNKQLEQEREDLYDTI
jgi:hypothetical protein